MEDILKIQESLCTGCGVCANVCPTDAIAMEVKAGYLKPSINLEKCVQCKLCDKKCPVVNSSLINLPVCYAAWADNKTRFNCSSGGAFLILAKQIIQLGGVVFGAAWTDDLFVKHTYVETIDEIGKLCRSKYVQSDVGDSYKKVKHFLKQDRYVMFVGTPCQVVGLEKFLEGESLDKLILVDFICYYNPPINIFHRYVDEKYGIRNLKKFTFRDKTKGWISHCTKAELTDGSVIYENKVDSYFDGYFNGLYAREACINCTFSGQNHHADITLGDFWKIEEHDASWNDGRGTSMLLANTVKGRLFVEKSINLFQRIQQVPKQWIRSGQSNCKKAHSGQKYFYDLLEYKTFDEAVDKALHTKYDIGMVCVQSYKNFGSAFTNFALFKVLKDLKQSVLIITQPLSSVIKPEQTDNFEVSPYKDFEQEQSYLNIDEMKAINKKCNIFLVGSDQLFNYEIYKQIDGFVKLDWVDDQHKKICYATSFGVDRILGTFEESANLKKSLNRFDAISIREDSGVDLVKNNFKVDATQVLDPVFLCKKEHYFELCKNISVGAIGIFAYVLDPSMDKELAIREVSDLYKKPVTAYVDRWMTEAHVREKWSLKCEFRKKNEYWLKSIMESDFVFTDSFHGMCMAIIFEKQFVVINNKNRGATRFLSLLKLLGLQDRLFDSTNDLLEHLTDLKEIDFEQVNIILEREKARSLEWLENAISR